MTWEQQVQGRCKLCEVANITGMENGWPDRIFFRGICDIIYVGLLIEDLNYTIFKNIITVEINCTLLSLLEGS